MRRFGEFITGAVLAIGLVAWGLAEYVLDMLGRADMLKQAVNSGGTIRKAFIWLFQTLWYVPTALALVIILIWSYFLYVELRDQVGRRNSSRVGPSRPYYGIKVAGKTYRNEKVVLDGFSYEHCNFSNVTFEYNGRTPVQFSNNEIAGALIKTDNEAVAGAIALIIGLGFIRDDIPIELGPNIQRPGKYSKASPRPSPTSPASPS